MINTLYLPELREMLATNNAAELREFHWMLRETAVGPRADRRMGGYMMGGRGYATRDGRGNFLRGRPMRSGRGFADRRTQMRGTRGFAGRGIRPGWRPNDIDPNN